MVGETLFHQFYLAATENTEDEAFHNDYMESLINLRTADKIETKTYAECVDRVLFISKGEQIMGTLVHFNENRDVVPAAPIQNPSQVDMIRNTIGLPPYEAFLAQLKKKHQWDGAIFCKDVNSK